jgi:ADP-heptose:LPS heptosyltransferase
MTNTVLALRPLGLGDLLTAVPALRGLRRAVPDADLVLAAPSALAPLAYLSEAVDDVIAATDVSGTLPLDSPAIAVDLHGNGPDSLQRLLATRPGRIVGFARPGTATGSPPWQAPDDPALLEHETSRWCRLIIESFTVTCDASDLTLPAHALPPTRAGVALVHPGAASGSRRWPAERYAAVARTLSGAGLEVAVTGSGEERRLAESVATLAALPERAVLAGRTSVLQLAALVSRAALVVSGDTGVAHLASAFETPSVVLFGPVSPSVWGPPHHPQHAVLWHGPDGVARPGDPHGETVDQRLDRITVEEVEAACGRVLDAPGAAA